MLLLAVQAILDDPGFTVSSPTAANAVQTAKQLQESSQSSVASQLVSELNAAFQPSSGGQKCHSSYRAIARHAQMLRIIEKGK